MREIIYGRNAVYECLRANRREVFSIQIAAGAQERGVLADILTLAGHRHIPIQKVERAQLDRLGQEGHHQGVAAQVSGYPYVGVGDILDQAARQGQPPWLLLLDCLQDPQNLGTLLRTAEVVGVHGLIIPDRRAAAVTPAVVNASAGACEHVRIAQITNLTREMEALKERNVWLIGLEDEPSATPLWQADLGGAVGLVVGSEGSGMRRLVRETCDLIVRLPMYGQINSLNAAVAGSIALYEIARRRHLS